MLGARLHLKMMWLTSAAKIESGALGCSNLGTCGASSTHAIGIVEETQCEDGRWTLQHSYKGKTYFELERLGAPSRWNTLRALRVLKWWRA